MSTQFAHEMDEWYDLPLDVSHSAAKTRATTNWSATTAIPPIRLLFAADMLFCLSAAVYPLATKYISD